MLKTVKMQKGNNGDLLLITLSFLTYTLITFWHMFDPLVQ